jgi:endonuclease G
MGRRIGRLGGRAGAASGHPASQTIQLVVGPGNRLIRARPVNRRWRRSDSPDEDGPEPPTRVAEPVSVPPAIAHIGLPTAAAASEDHPNDFLISDEGSHSIASYNRDLLIPNWVAWTLEASDLGEADRGPFREDDRIPSHWERPLVSALHDSPYDEGHVRPRSDRTATDQQARDTFRVGTNTFPQIAENNEGPWNSLERELRRLVTDEHRRVVVISGPIFRGPVRRLGGRAIPDATFKIAVVLEHGQSWTSVNEHTRVIGAILPNTPGSIDVTENWQRYRVPVAQIAREAHLPGLFSGLSSRVRGALLDPHRVDAVAVPDEPGEHAGDFHNRRFSAGQRVWSPTN